MFIRFLLLFMVSSFIGCSASGEDVEIANKQVKPVAVMVHGAGGGGWEWDFWKEVFEKSGWEVISPDLEASEKGIKETGYEDYLKQVIDWCPNDDRKFVFIGASMGGLLTLSASEHVNPEAIVLINSVPPKGMTSWKREFDVPDVIEWSKSELQETRDALWDSDEKTILWAHERWRDESGKVLRELSDAQVQIPKVRVLVVASSLDTDIKPEVSLELARALGADYFEYSNMSHVGPLLSTRAKDVARQVLNWLNQLH